METEHQPGIRSSGLGSKTPACQRRLLLTKKAQNIGASSVHVLSERKDQQQGPNLQSGGSPGTDFLTPFARRALRLVVLVPLSHK